MTKEGDDIKSLEFRVRRLELAFVFLAGLMGSGVVPETLRALFLK